MRLREVNADHIYMQQVIEFLYWELELGALTQCKQCLKKELQQKYFLVAFDEFYAINVSFPP